MEFRSTTAVPYASISNRYSATQSASCLARKVSLAVGHGQVASPAPRAQPHRTDGMVRANIGPQRLHSPAPLADRLQEVDALKRPVFGPHSRAPAVTVGQIERDDVGRQGSVDRERSSPTSVTAAAAGSAATQGTGRRSQAHPGQGWGTTDPDHLVRCTTCQRGTSPRPKRSRRTPQPVHLWRSHMAKRCGKPGTSTLAGGLGDAPAADRDRGPVRVRDFRRAGTCAVPLLSVG